MRATTLLVAFLLVFVAPPLTTNATAQSAAAAVINMHSPLFEWRNRR